MKVSNLKQDSEEFLTQPRDVMTNAAQAITEHRTLTKPSFEEAALRFLARYQSHETRRTYGTTLRELQSFLAQRNRSRSQEASHSLSAVDLTLISEISEEDLLEFRRAIEENHRIKAHANTVRRVQTTIARKISTQR
jgi:hypothetical protein